MSHEEALASIERGDFTTGLAEAREALKHATGDEAGQIGLTIAWIELERGNLRACAREVSKAKDRGAKPARVTCMNGLRLCAAGSYEHAVTELSEAVKALRDDPKWQANALVGSRNRARLPAETDRRGQRFRHGSQDSQRAR